VAEGSNRKWKVETKHVDNIRCWRHKSFACVLFDTIRGYFSTIIRFKDEGGLQAPSPPRFRWCRWHTHWTERLASVGALKLKSCFRATHDTVNTSLYGSKQYINSISRNNVIMSHIFIALKLLFFIYNLNITCWLLAMFPSYLLCTHSANLHNIRFGISGTTEAKRFK